MDRTPNTDWEMLKAGGFLPEGPPQADLWDVWDNTFDGIEQRERKLDIVADQPLLLRPDGSADRDILAYLNSYSFRDLARETQQAYARDLKIFLSFLWSPLADGRAPIDWRAATKKTLEDYAVWRRFSDENPKPVSGTRFAREVAALRRFFEWAADEGLIDRSPVALRARRLRDGTTVQSAEIRPKDVKSVRMKWLAPNAYEQWRRVGMEGYRPDHLPDLSWRGRNEARNAALAQTLWWSGLRICEGGTLLCAEVPGPPDDGYWSDGWVAKATAKGRGRQYLIKYDALRAIDKYQRTNRAEAVRRAQEAGLYDGLRDILVASPAAQERLLIQNGRGDKRMVSFDNLGPEDRLKLFIAGDEGLEPAMLWLSETGMPMSHRSWQKVFRRANTRCALLGVGSLPTVESIFCKPHMLRHSFALHMLLVFKEECGEDEACGYVQDLLGHSNREITKDIYLAVAKNTDAKAILNRNEGDPETARSSAAAYRHMSKTTGLIQEAAAWSPGRTARS